MSKHLDFYPPRVSPSPGSWAFQHYVVLRAVDLHKAASFGHSNAAHRDTGRGAPKSERSELGVDGFGLRYIKGEIRQAGQAI